MLVSHQLLVIFFSLILLGQLSFHFLELQVLPNSNRFQRYLASLCLFFIDFHYTVSTFPLFSSGYIMWFIVGCLAFLVYIWFFLLFVSFSQSLFPHFCCSLLFPHIDLHFHIYFYFFLLLKFFSLNFFLCLYLNS